MLLPDDEEGGATSYAIGGDKLGAFWFIDRANPGKCVDSGGHTCSTSCSPNPPQCVANSSTIGVYWTGGSGCPGAFRLHNTPAFWENSNGEYLYIAPFFHNVNPAGYGGYLTKYTLHSSPRNPPIDSAQQSNVLFHYGATPTISATASGAADAIVWAIDKQDSANPQGTQPAVLHAFKASDVTVELYNSGTCAADVIVEPTEFSVPTIANGHVYIGTEDEVGYPIHPTNTGKGRLYIFGTVNRPNGC